MGVTTHRGDRDLRRGSPDEQEATRQEDRLRDREDRALPLLAIDLPEHARFMTVEARSGDRLIGSARIPTTDFCPLGVRMG